MPKSILQVERLTAWIETRAARQKVVDSVSFSLAPGETFALVGESGSGKSMTALAIMRLLPPSGHVSGGQVLLQEEDLLALPEAAMRRVRGKKIGMIFQEPMTSLNPVMTIGEQIAESIRLHEPGAADIPGRVVELLQAVGLPDAPARVHAYPFELSGGQKQRVMIAIALAAQPEILIADEPTTALDVTIQAQILALLRQLQQQYGMALMLITHDLGVVAEMATQVGVMYAGQLVEVAPRDVFFAGPKHPYSQKLFAALPGKATRGQPLDVIPGSVPGSAQAGCRFYDRCPQALPSCALTPPPWAEAAPQQGVRCWRYAPGQPGAETPAAAPAATASFFRPHGSDTPLLQVDDLKVYFPIRKGLFKRTVGYVKAVDGVSLSLGRGRTLALVGESGSGKTTAAKAILQLIPPTAGRITFAGQSLRDLNPAALRRMRADLQIVFQDPYASLNPRMMVQDIVEEGMVALQPQMTAKERQARMDALLDRVGLPLAAKQRYPHEFSGGQRQRIAIARALAVNPKLIICDEPTSALDVSVQAQILNLLLELQQEMGLSYLFITHNLAVVQQIAHEVAVMYLGRIVEQGRVEEVLEHPKHPYTQALLSSVPVIDPAARRPIIRLKGDMPSPAHPPSGCHFHPRCPKAFEPCASVYPGETRLGGTHRVHCHLYDAAEAGEKKAAPPEAVRQDKP